METTTQPSGPTALAARFAREAPLQWAAATESVRQIQGEFVGTLVADWYAKPVIKAYRYWLNNTANCEKIEYNSLDVAGIPSVEGANPDYAFTIGPSITSHSTYMLSKFQWREGSPSVGSPLDPRFFLRFFATKYAGGGLDLTDIVNGKAGKITAYDETVESGQRLLKITYLRNSIDKQPPVSGFAVVDPGNYWSVVEWRQDFASDLVAGKNVFQHIGGGVPFPKTIIETDASPVGKIRQTETFVFGVPVKCDLEPAAFYLPSYGIDAPQKVSAHTAHAPFLWINLMILVAAAVVLLFMAILRLRSGRKALKSKTGPGL